MKKIVAWDDPDLFQALALLLGFGFWVASAKGSGKQAWGLEVQPKDKGWRVWHEDMPGNVCFGYSNAQGAPVN